MKAITQSFFFSLALSAHLSAAPGQVDLTFDAGSGIDAHINAIAPAADGKIMIAGTFSATEHAGQSGVARLNRDGTTDLQFNSSGLFATRVAAPGDDPVWTLAQTPDGKTVIGGKFYVNGMGENICRLDADGALDQTFRPPISWGLSSHMEVRSVVVQPDGNVLVGGNFSGSGTPGRYLVRLLPSGAVDPSFNTLVGGGVGSLALQSDGKILCTAGSDFRRLHPNGKMIRVLFPRSVQASPPLRFNLITKFLSVFLSSQLQKTAASRDSIPTERSIVPIPLLPARTEEGITLRWSNAALLLQSSTAPEGPYTTISSAKSPWRIPQHSTSAFFRLSSQ